MSEPATDRETTEARKTRYRGYYERLKADPAAYRHKVAQAREGMRRLRARRREERMVKRSDPIELVWTDKTPTRPGGYWTRKKSESKRADILWFCRETDGNLYANGIAVERWEGRDWAGPITEPKEPTGGPPC